MARQTRSVSLLHITTVPQSLGFVRHQVRYVADRGFAVHAISSPGPRLAEFGREQDVPTHAVEMPRRITPLGDLVALYRIWRLLRRIRPTIVHSHTPKGGLLGTLAAWLARVPVRIYHMRGLPHLAATGHRRSLLRLSERVACAAAHQVIAISPSIARIAVQEGLCRPTKIKVLRNGGNGLDAVGRFNPSLQDQPSARSHFCLPADALVLGFAGRIVRDKGIEDMVSAWRSLRDRYPDLHLVIAGVLEPQDPISDESEGLLRTDPRVHLLGHVRDMPAVYAALDLLVLPTYREGLPNVPLEGSAMGLPVVATNVPGCIDAVVNGVTGTLVPPRDPAALADAIARYLDDPELRRRHGLAGRERVLRDFRPEDIWEATYQEYVRLLRERGLSVPEPSEARP